MGWFKARSAASEPESNPRPVRKAQVQRLAKAMKEQYAAEAQWAEDTDDTTFTQQQSRRADATLDAVKRSSTAAEITEANRQW